MTPEEKESAVELLTAQFMWDLEELTDRQGHIIFPSNHDWSTSSGQFLAVINLSEGLFVSANWRYRRPPFRPTDSTKWNGKVWSDYKNPERKVAQP